MAAVPTRYCRKATCGAELRPHPGERAGRFKARNFCGDGCRKTRGVPADQEPPRRCELESCGREYRRAKGESDARYRERRTCSKGCQAEWAKVDPDAARERVNAGRRRRRAEARPAAADPSELSVFGDVPPDTPWRPAAWGG